MQSSTSYEEMKIIELFKENVYERSPDANSFNQHHDGKDGHWLERQMNRPRIFGDPTF